MSEPTGEGVQLDPAVYVERYRQKLSLVQDEALQYAAYCDQLQTENAKLKEQIADLQGGA